MLYGDTALAKNEKANFAHHLRKLPSGAPLVEAEFGRETPQEFITEILGEKPSPAALRHGIDVPWTPDQDRVMRSVVENERTAVPSGVGTGKTRIASRIALWWLYRRRNSVVVTSAPGERQIKELLWGEIGEGFSLSVTPLPGNLQSMKLALGHKWYAIGIPVPQRVGQISATTFQGYHSAYVLVIYDEATGVYDYVWEGGTGIAVRPTDRQLAIGNPTDPASHFGEICRSGLWNVIHLDCRDHPNVIHDDPDIVPGATTKAWIDARRDEYGEGTPLWVAKVTGHFPDQATDALISPAWVEKAQRRWEQEPKTDDKGTALGLDVAREGDDLTVLWAIRDGKAWIPKIDGKYAWHTGKDTVEGTNLVRAALRELEDVRAIAIDDTGVGGAITDNLRDLQRKKKLPRWRAGGITSPEGKDVWIIARNFGASALRKEKYANAKSEMWWQTREVLRKDQLNLPTEHEVKRYSLPKGSDMSAQVIRPLYEATKHGGRIIVYDKKGPEEKAQKLPTKSPDVGHGLILAVDAWTRLSPKKAPPPLKTTQQIFDAQTRAILEKTSRRPRKKGPRSPWMKRGRR